MHTKGNATEGKKK